MNDVTIKPQICLEVKLKQEIKIMGFHHLYVFTEKVCLF